MKDLEYDEFEVVLERIGDGYVARVVEAPTGPTPAMPFVPPSEVAELPELRQAIRGGAGETAPESGAAALDPKAFGTALFAALFNDKAAAVYRTSHYVSAQHGRGLRLRIRLSGAAELANLPWELLYDPERHWFPCQLTRFPIVRFVDIPEPVPPITVSGALRMLVVISSPNDLPELEVEKEWMLLKQELEPLVDAGRIELVRLPTPTLEALHAAVLGSEEGFHLFHFIGHGSIDAAGQGHLAFVQPTGQARWVTGSQLGVILSTSPIRLAVLNSCQGGTVSAVDPYGSAAIALVEQGIPAVVAMQFPISDRAATAFSRTLYDSVSAGRPVDLGVTLGRQAVLATSETEWATPVLYLRARDAVLFERAGGPVKTILADPIAVAPTPAPVTAPAGPGDVAPTAVPVPTASTPEDLALSPALVTAAAGPVELGPTDASVPAPSSLVDVALSVPEPPPPPPPVPPLAPTNLDGTVRAGTVDLSWAHDPTTDAEVLDWEVFRDGALVSRVMVAKTRDVPPGPGTYRYTVVATGKVGLQSPPSQAWTAVIPEPTVVVPPASDAAPLPAQPVTVAVRRKGRVLAVIVVVLLALVGGVSAWVLSRPDTQAVATPTIVKNSFEAGLVSIAWEQPAVEGRSVETWEVYLGEKLITTVREPTFSATPEAPGQFDYRVVAVASDGSKSAGAPAPVLVPSTTPPTTPPTTVPPQPKPTTAELKIRRIGVTAAEGDAETVTFETDNYGKAEVINEQVFVEALGGGQIHAASFRFAPNGAPQPCTIEGSQASCDIGRHRTKGTFHIEVTVGWVSSSTGLRATVKDTGGTRDPDQSNNVATYDRVPPSTTMHVIPPDSITVIPPANG